MYTVPKDVKEFAKLKPWWRTEVPTDVVLSADGIGDLYARLEREGRKPFFVIDKALETQPEFAKIFAEKTKFVFDATFSEPRTGDVDSLVAVVRACPEHPDVMVGIGGGATMDLTKATAICTANPKPAQEYQGWGQGMVKGLDIWVLPALNGTGAEITPIAVLRGPEKKLGINNAFTESEVAIIDPQLSRGAKKFNRFFTMMDCYYHHYEITQSKTSSPDAILDAHDGKTLASEALLEGLGEYSISHAIKSAMASILGGSSTIGGRVGAAHAISYGLSNSAPKLPHSVAVTISMLALEDLYPDGYADTIKFLEANGMARPKASEYGITEADIAKMTKTALGLDKLWQSCFGEADWKEKATADFMTKIYKRIVEA
ncbi:MAG: iron-containing alcohol dehydrogenase [Synergistaceae bacterium]|nr:iron-containing alcohol dehydrogenase [Synergistaceae bacterium]